MKFKKISFCLMLVVGFIFATMKLVKAAPGISPANTSNIDNLMLDRGTIYDANGNAAVFIGTTGVFTIVSPNDLYFGSATQIAITTTTTSGSGQGSIFTAFLASGPASGSGVSIPAIEGSVLCSTTPQQGQANSVTVVVCVASSSLTSWIGTASGPASTGTLVNFFTSGIVLALTTGTISAGDIVVTSATSSGYLGVAPLASTTIPAAIVGVAMGPGPSGGGLTKIRIR